MAAPKSVWGVDIGQCALKAIKLRYDGKADRAVVEAFDYVEHPLILSQPDANPDELIRAAMEKFLSRNEIEQCHIYISIPGQTGLAKFVKLPPVEPKKVPDIVKFEVKQHIPFPLDEVVWDYQTIGGGEETEGMLLDSEVGIFAIRRDKVSEFLAPYTAMRIEVNVVQLAPLALYNFAAYDHFYHGSRAAKEQGNEEHEAETTILLDMGADKTDVVITDGDSIWLRNLPIGGNHFTRALTRELKLTFAKAEHLKRNATKAPDPKKLYQAMRPVFQDFVSELQRSIGYFNSTHRNRTISKLLGVGNAFKLPGLQKFLQQNLQYDVDRVTSFNGITGDMAAEAAFTENLPSFCVAYGLALQGLNQTPIQTNLLPQEIRNARLIRAKKPFVLTAAAAILLGCAVVFLGNFRAYSAVKNPAFEQPKKSAENETKTIIGFKTSFDGAISAFNDSRKQAEVLLGAENGPRRLEWLKVLKVINDQLPRRSAAQDERQIEFIEELSVEQIQAVYLTDTATWYSGLKEDAKSKLGSYDKPDGSKFNEKESGPTGEGWVFQLLGYTFHDSTGIFVQDTLLKRLQEKEARAAGIAYATMVRYEWDETWTPSKGSSKLRSDFPKIEELAKLTGGGNNSGNFGGSSGGVANPFAMGGGLGGMSNMSGGDAQMAEMMKSYSQMQDMSSMVQPREFLQYTENSIASNQKNEKTLPRTDFAIQFLWFPPATEKKDATAK